MTCGEIQKRFSAYLDGELESDQKATMEVHLRGCEACQRALKTLTETWDLVVTIPEAESAPYFYTRLKARIASEERRRRWGWVERVLVPASAVAVVILGVLVGSTVGRNGEGWAGEPSAEEKMVSSLYLDSFDDFPSTSLGEAYFGLADEE